MKNRFSGAPKTFIRRTLLTLLDLGLRAFYRIEVRGLEHFTRSPSTLVIANHRGDADGPIVAGVLMERHGLAIHGNMTSFVAREDLFQRGFLREYLTN